MNSLNNVNSNNTCESKSPNNNLISSAKLETETDKINIKLKINSEVINNNIKINAQNENNMDFKGLTGRYNSSKQRGKQSESSSREFVKKFYFFKKFIILS